jgi:hypothetical protein
MASVRRDWRRSADSHRLVHSQRSHTSQWPNLFFGYAWLEDFRRRTNCGDNLASADITIQDNEPILQPATDQVSVREEEPFVQLTVVQEWRNDTISRVKLCHARRLALAGDHLSNAHPHLPTLLAVSCRFSPWS